MRAASLNIFLELRASYWFLPSLMALAALVLAVVMVTLDGQIGSAWIAEVDWLYANQPAGARAVLSTIAGSMITVAGVTFSMTILTVSFAAGQIGPRLMGNFMRDRGNQITLGTFISTFLYCLMVLRTVRNAGEGEVEASDTIGAFVPHLSVLLALVLSMASVGVLIFFIHHVPESINVSNVIAAVGKQLNDMVDKQFPSRIGEAGDEHDMSTLCDDLSSERGKSVEASRDGYIRAIDERAIMSVAKSHDLVVRLRYRPGDYVTEGKTMLIAWPAERIDDEALSSLASLFAIGSQRTQHQNMFFLIDEFAEIIARALSPGVNDPFTAIACLNWLQSFLVKLASTEPPAAVRTDEEGRPRVLANPVSFAGVLGHIFDQIRPYVSADRNASMHAIKVLGEVGVDLEPGSHQDALMRQATLLQEACDQALVLDSDREAIRIRYHEMREAISSRANLEEMRDDQSWLGGSA